MNKLADKYSLSLWSLVLVLMVTFTVLYSDDVYNNSGRSAFASQENDEKLLLIKECSADGRVFAWGNQSLGRGRVDFGCFDQSGQQLGEVSSLAACQFLACN